MSFKKVKVGDFLIRKKDTIPIIDSEEYKLVTIRLYHNGVQLRKVVKGSEIQADRMSRVKAGQFILSGIDARNGAFGIIPNELDGAVVTNDFWHFEIDKNIISDEYFLWLTSTPYFDDICNKASDGTTNRIRLQADRFYCQELMIPEIHEQHKVVEKLKTTNNKIKQLEVEYNFQLTQLENLNQAILQESVQGKLVPQNPADEPASQLLKRIKAEKEKLINEGRLAKDKIVNFVNDVIPFNIPNTWVWCRLNEIADALDPNPSHRMPRYVNAGIPFISTENFREDDSIDFSIGKKVTNETLQEHIERYEIHSDSFAFSRIGSIGKTIKLSIERNYCLSHALSIINPFSKEINLQYLRLVMSSSFILKQAKKDVKSISVPDLGMAKIRNFFIPLPPLSEQTRIVAEIEKQLAKTKQLKEHIVANQQATEQLLKALLHEAFQVSAAKEVKAGEKEAKVIELKYTPTNVDYYKRTVLAAEIVWQLHQEPTLGHVKLQKLIYLCQKTADMQLPTNFLRQAMGPYDPQMMRSIDKQFIEKKWFDFQISEVLKYKPLEKAGQHNADFEKYFSAEQSSIQYIIDTFKTEKSDFVQIVGTLYACLDKMKDEKLVFSEGLLLQRFYGWSDEKKKFPESEVKKAYKRMLELGIVPK